MRIKIGLLNPQPLVVVVFWQIHCYPQSSFVNMSRYLFVSFVPDLIKRTVPKGYQEHRVSFFTRPPCPILPVPRKTSTKTAPLPSILTMSANKQPSTEEPEMSLYERTQKAKQDLHKRNMEEHLAVATTYVRTPSRITIICCCRLLLHSSEAF